MDLIWETLAEVHQQVMLALVASTFRSHSSSAHMWDSAGIIWCAWTLRDRCAVQGSQILTRFAEHRKLQQVVVDATAAARTGAAPPVDPVQVDALLSEMRGLCACGQEFSAVMLATMQAAAAPRALPAAASESLRTGALGSSLRELQASYVVLEEYYMQQGVAKAIAIDTVLEVRGCVCYGLKGLSCYMLVLLRQLDELEA
jgi:hypothetical protein